MIDLSKTYRRYHYDKAPLQEVIFEARFSDDSYDLTLPGRFFDRISRKFPKKKEIQNNTFFISPYPLTTPPIIQTPVMQAWNENHNSCLQIGPGIISANDISYLNWERFSDNIKILLDGYFDCASPSIAQRIGYRCINRFVIPSENTVLSDYFRLGCILPNELINPSGLGFNIFKEYDFKNKKISIILKFYSDTLREGEKGVAFLLDIDSFATEEITVEKQAILNAVSDCHDLEKIIFESLLQDKTRALMGATET